LAARISFLSRSTQLSTLQTFTKFCPWRLINDHQALHWSQCRFAFGDDGLHVNAVRRLA
jgi:hypothetical protein